MDEVQNVRICSNRTIPVNHCSFMVILAFFLDEAHIYFWLLVVVANVIFLKFLLVPYLVYCFYKLRSIDLYTQKTHNRDVN